MVAVPSLSQTPHSVAKSEAAVVYNTNMIPPDVRSAMRKKTGSATRKPSADKDKACDTKKGSHKDKSTNPIAKDTDVVDNGTNNLSQDPPADAAKVKKIVRSKSTSDIELVFGSLLYVDHGFGSAESVSGPDDNSLNAEETRPISQDCAKQQVEKVQHAANSSDSAALEDGHKLKEASADNFGFMDSALDVLEVKPDLTHGDFDTVRPSDDKENGHSLTPSALTGNTVSTEVLKHDTLDESSKNNECAMSDDALVSGEDVKEQCDNKMDNDEDTDDYVQTGATLEESREKFPPISNLLDISDTSTDENSGSHGSADQSQDCQQSENMTESLISHSGEQQNVTSVKTNETETSENACIDPGKRGSISNDQDKNEANMASGECEEDASIAGDATKDDSSCAVDMLDMALEDMENLGGSETSDSDN